MNFDPSTHLGCTTRVVRNTERDGRPAKAIIVARTFDTDAADLWDAIASPERIPQWFAPVSGDLRLGGRYQIEGNASGEITACDPPSQLALTWAFADQMSWVTVRLSPEEGRALLELEHVAHVDISDPDDHWSRYGPGAGGLGWELGFLGLARHLVEPETELLEAGFAWMATAEAKDFYRAVSAAWARAAVGAGEPEDDALAAAERNRAFYSGEESPG